jgi:hypothetical protein
MQGTMTKHLAATLTLLTLGHGCSAADVPGLDDGKLDFSGGQIPHVRFAPASATDFDFSPSLGIDLSRRHLLVFLRENYGDQELTEVLRVARGQIAGTIPFARVLRFEYPAENTLDDLQQRIDALEGLPGVSRVVRDSMLGPTALPAEGVDIPRYVWNAPGGSNWHLEAIRAPLAWNIHRRLKELGRRVDVALLDTAFPSHPDLEISVQSRVGRVGSHGTSTAGLIGAKWNGSFATGLMPELVRLQGLELARLGMSPDGQTRVTTFGAALEAVAIAAVNSSPRPRIVSVSMGYNWDTFCYGPPGGPQKRCDPRAVPGIPDSGCDGAAVARLIAAQGQSIGDVVAAASVGLTPSEQVLFITSAGNNAGEPIASGDWCANQERCRLGQADCDQRMVGKTGMGAISQDLSNPLAWAAANHPALKGQHAIIAEASGMVEGNSWKLARASFSAVNQGHGGVALYAPGLDVGVLETINCRSGGNGNAALGCPATDGAPLFNLRSGTSLSAPLVAGSAAFLVAAQPDLSNAELVKCLTSSLYADELRSERSKTTASLNLFSALVCIDQERGTDQIKRWLVDIDDGTRHGFERFTYHDDGTVDEKVTYDTHGDGLVTIKDFRRLRDTYLIAAGKLTFDDRDHPKLDLNEDGALPREKLDIGLQETWARAAFHFPWVKSATGDRPDAAQFLQEQRYGSQMKTAVQLIMDTYDEWANAEKQSWPAAALPELIDSTELYFRPKAALEELGADGAYVMVVADKEGNLPAKWQPYAAQLKDISQKGFRISKDDAKDLMLTVPIFEGMRLRWVPRYPDRSTTDEDWIDQSLPILKAGQPAVVQLEVPPKRQATAKNVTVHLREDWQREYLDGYFWGKGYEDYLTVWDYQAGTRTTTKTIWDNGKPAPETTTLVEPIYSVSGPPVSRRYCAQGVIVAEDGGEYKTSGVSMDGSYAPVKKWTRTYQCVGCDGAPASECTCKPPPDPSDYYWILVCKTCETYDIRCTVAP